jgi:hypothetical protein
MKPVKQTRRGGPDAPPEERGDCFDACLASLLEVPIQDVHVPHDDNWWDHAVAVVARYGHRLLMIYDGDASPWKATATALGEWLGDVFWIAAIPSTSLGHYPDGRPVGHVVVMRGAELVHDPGLGPPRPHGVLSDDVPILDAILLVPLATERAA